MSKAYLTIDDAPTKLTPKIMDYLDSKGIVPVINMIGVNIEPYFEEAVYAVRKGAIIGNHSFTHSDFSTLTIEECWKEIQQTEEQIRRIYLAAGMERKYLVFRFPYGNKGGANATLIQKMLREEFQFDHIDDSKITFPWWKECHVDEDQDLYWTFDFVEYQLAWNNDFTWKQMEEHMLNPAPEQGGALLDENSMNIILIHDMVSTEEFMPNYFEKILDKTLSLGVEFLDPKFILHKKI